MGRRDGRSMKDRRMLIGVAGAVLGLLLLPQNAVPDDGDPVEEEILALRPRATLPYREGGSGELLIEGELAGRKALLILDTGSSGSTVSERLAEKLGLEILLPTRRDGSPYVHPNGERLRGIVVPLVKLGAVTVESEKFVLAPDKLLRSGKEPVDGLLGVSTLLGLSMLFDFQKKQVTFRKPGGLSPLELKVSGMDGAVEIPMVDRSGDLCYQVGAKLNGGVEEAFLLDTGAHRTMISRAAARKLKLKGKPSGKAWFPLEHRQVETLEARLSTFEIGGLTLRDVVVDFPSSDVDAPVLLGRDILTRFRVMVDYLDDKLLLRRLADTPGKKD
jgi:predicted aspartyl protease